MTVDMFQFAKYFQAYLEYPPEIQEVVRNMTQIIMDENSTDEEKQLAGDVLVESFLPVIGGIN